MLFIEMSCLYCTNVGRFQLARFDEQEMIGHVCEECTEVILNRAPRGWKPTPRIPECITENCTNDAVAAFAEYQEEGPGLGQVTATLRIDQTSTRYFCLECVSHDSRDDVDVDLGA